MNEIVYKTWSSHITLSAGQPWRVAVQVGVHADGGRCWAEFSLGRHALWLQIPQLFRPARRTASTSHGNVDLAVPRQFGISMDAEAVHLYYGAQPGYSGRRDPDDNRSFCWLVAWNQTRRERYDFLNPDGSVFRRLDESSKKEPELYKIIAQTQDLVPKIKFSFNDHDGQLTTASCHVTEMCWKYGTGLFKWTGIFRRPLVRRRLQMHFSGAVGPGKNTWKGGITAHSVEILDGELPEQAFIRYGTSYSFTNIKMENSNE